MTNNDKNGFQEYVLNHYKAFHWYTPYSNLKLLDGFEIYLQDLLNAASNGDSGSAIWMMIEDYAQTRYEQGCMDIMENRKLII